MLLCRIIAWPHILRVALITLFVSVMVLSATILIHPQPARAASSPDSTPLLLVHGFSDNCVGAFEATDANDPVSAYTYLQNHGWPNLVQVGYYSANNEPGCDDNVNDYSSHCTGVRGSADGYTNDPINYLACMFAWYVATKYGSQPVNILAHSMGGLVVRAAIGESGKTNNAHYNASFPTNPLTVRRVVTVATPHAGISGVYVTYGEASFGSSQELTDLTAGSGFLNMVSGIQAPQGSGGTFWGLMAASSDCFTAHNRTLSCSAESNGQNDPYPDGDGVVQASSGLAMHANYKVLYGVVTQTSGGVTQNTYYSTQGTNLAVQANEYGHEVNSCGNVLGNNVCLQPPFYLNDATPDSQQTRAWLCTSNCNGTNFSDMHLGATSAVPVFYALAEIAWLLAPASHVNTGQVTYVMPSMATFNNQMYVAWTGTDTRLNLMSSRDGVNFSGPTTLSDTSPDGPSLAGFKNDLFIAWEGTDSAHHIYIQYYTGSGFGGHTALPETTYNAPAIAVFNGRLYLAWTGTDPSHHINVESSTDGITFGNKVTLNAFSGLAPALNGYIQQNMLVLAWTGLDSAHHLNIGTSTNGTTFSQTTLSDTTFWAPALTHNDGILDLVWVGTNSHLNVESSTYPLGIDQQNKDTINDTSNAAAATASFNGHLYVAWSGTDNPSHLYVAGEY